MNPQPISTFPDVFFIILHSSSLCNPGTPALLAISGKIGYTQEKSEGDDSP